MLLHENYIPSRMKGDHQPKPATVGLSADLHEYRKFPADVKNVGIHPFYPAFCCRKYA